MDRPSCSPSLPEADLEPSLFLTGRTGQEWELSSTSRCQPSARLPAPSRGTRQHTRTLVDRGTEADLALWEPSPWAERLRET